MPNLRFKQFPTSLPFYLMHLAVLSLLWIPFRWELMWLCVGGYVIRMFGITAGYHRYFSHKSYETSRAFQFFLAFLGGSALQKGALWWASHHRWHHRYSDEPKDAHSPVQRGFWYSHIGWFLGNDYDETLWKLIPEYRAFPELKWLNQYHWVPGAIYAAALYIYGGLPAFLYGFILSTVLLYHGTFSINSLSHVYGTARYQTGDQSKNNFVLALFTLGEGWHNNHHAYMSSTRQGFFWWELDISYLILKFLSLFGIVRNLKAPSMAVLRSKEMSQSTVSLKQSLQSSLHSSTSNFSLGTAEVN